MKINILLLNIVVILGLIACSKEGVSNVTPNGKSGSMARMIVVEDYMYVVDNQNLKTFDISIASDPKEVFAQEVGFGIETIFPFANYLFIGSTNGMFIYDISDPAKPTTASSQHVEHFRSCDPVVANENYAYVTLNTISTNCGNTSLNVLQIVNVQNILKPFVEAEINMEGPKGLGIDGNNLFICDKNLGVKVYDLTNPVKPSLVTTLSGFTANDLIPDNGNLLVVCDDGLRQFDYTDINNITKISYLEIND